MDMKLINANRLIMHLNDWQLAEGCAEGWNYKKDKVVTDQERQQSIYDTIQQCIDAVMEQPTVDAELIRHGHWEDGYRGKLDGTRHWFRVCSNCGYEREDDNIELDTNYCPNCGAKMEKR